MLAHSFFDRIIIKKVNRKVQEEPQAEVAAIKVAGNQNGHKSSDEFDFGPLVSMAHLYVVVFF